jgi:hypothetical protein
MASDPESQFVKDLANKKVLKRTTLVKMKKSVR